MNPDDASAESVIGAWVTNFIASTRSSKRYTLNARADTLGIRSQTEVLDSKPLTLLSSIEGPIVRSKGLMLWS